ncbi:MAG: trigger factor [Eubacteriales bacterium]|nr:trigger factor [Eubacteriales bacterium]
MNVKVEKLEHSMVKLTVSVPEEIFKAATVKAYNKNKGKFNIPGFRKGKAPKDMIEKIYGKGVFYEDAVDEVLNDTYTDALKEADIDPASRPQVGIETLEEGKDFVYTAEVAVKPEVKLGQYKGVEVEKEAVKVTAAEVDAKIAQERERSARIVAIEDASRKVKKDDIVTIDFEGFVDGKAFDGGKGEDYDLTIGSHTFIDTFEDQLVGKKAGDEVEVNVTFPEGYQATELAGKPALFKVTVKEIKEKQLPELNDEFASEVSEYETLKEYKAAVKKDIEAEKAKYAAQQNENNVIKAVVANAEADIPEAMIDFTSENMLNDYAQRLSQQGIPFDQYMKITGQTYEGLKAQMRETAVNNIMINLVLEGVAAAEKMEATDEDIAEQIKKMADMYKIEEEKVKEILGDEGIKNIKADVLCQKAIDFLVAEAKLTEKKAAKKAKAEAEPKAEDDKVDEAKEEAPKAKKSTTCRKHTKKAE